MRGEQYSRKRGRPDWQKNTDISEDDRHMAVENTGGSPCKIEKIEKADSRKEVFESEYTFEGESGLQTKVLTCDKNPGHQNFIPIAEFTKEHLPEFWQDDRVVEFLKVRADLVVRIMMNRTSEQRPNNDVFAGFRGKIFSRFGSGMVWRVSRRFAKNNGQPCPCPECSKKPAEAKTQWGQFGVVTATHVVFNDDECRSAKCALFYDNDADKRTCPQLQGVRIWSNEENLDYCKISCITHDKEVSEKLEKLVDEYERLHSNIERTFARPKYVNEEACVVISHPHGMVKQISIGVRTEREELPPHRWTYTTATCPGSSGAPVCLLRNIGWRKPYLPTSTHSKCKGDKNENVSCSGWAFIM